MDERKYGLMGGWVLLIEEMEGKRGRGDGGTGERGREKEDVMKE